MDNLKQEDLIPSVKNDLSVQDYSVKKTIEGVRIMEIKRFAGEDGTFEDLLRVNEKGYTEIFPEMQVRQINRSKLIPGSVKAWHIHLKQEDLWYIPPEDHMILGLWDLREASVTKDIKMKIVMGNGASKLVLVPRGVAHGVVNVARKPGTIIYVVNNQYNLQDPDELRLPWDKAGTQFWEVEKG